MENSWTDRVRKEVLQGVQEEKKILTYLLNPWSKVLEMRTGSQIVKKFPAFCGTRRFFATFETAHHLSLS
jgi:hypothetical protein